MPHRGGEHAVSTERVPHAAMDRCLGGCLDGPDGATGRTRHVRASVSQGVTRGTRGYSRGSSKAVFKRYSRS